MRKVLFIEDNEDVRELTKDMLELANFEVTTAENGKLGIERAKQVLPDIIICDIMMPEADGYEVLKALSEDQKTASIPFIFLTAKSEKTDMRKGMNMGADDYLIKPFEEKELLDAIESRLERRNFLKQEFSKNLDGINEFLEEASQYMDIESLTKNYYLDSYKKKQELFREGHHAGNLFFVESGSVKTYKTTVSGKSFVTGLYGAGDFVGQMSLFNEKGTYVETASVLSDTKVCSIPKDDFTKLLYGNKIVSNKFINMVSNNLIEVQMQLTNMAFNTVRQRAAKAILDLQNKGMLEDAEGLGINISREDFAGLIGTAPETAIRMLSEFKDESLIELGSHRSVLVLNEKELRRIADFG
jgi:CheY-like chemotaxis protein/CRP-like cAMP-binding protein